MKTISTILLSLTIIINCSAQTKILYDATKAETAGNADWVIDADQFNLGYGSNSSVYIGGNESNPQRIPTPNQSGITSSTSQNYWTGALSAWAVDNVKLGYIVETLPYNGSITYGNLSNPQDLSYYNVFIVCEPNIIFSTGEKTAIMNFVQNGGGLFMISDHDVSDRNNDGYDSPHIWNDFMQNNTVQNNPFGFTFDYNNFSETTSNIPNLPNDSLLHGSYGNVTSVKISGGTSLTLNTSQNASVKGVVYRTGYSNTGNTGVLCAYATFGAGKVAALTDSSPPDDGTGDSGDNLYDGWIADANGNHERLIMNATIWLATNGIPVFTFNKSKINNFLVYSFNKEIIAKNNTYKSIEIQIFNINGKLIIDRKKIISQQNITFNLQKSGIYFYQILQSKETLKTGKLIIN